ncbi:MAG: nucleotide sugar dehydrogenase [Oligoflexia bacterium]|nr:nucleotide sugar dehydrogenase [Oligoflexia bacterium]MBF0366299.1 nucleotide sugar dehydrogenase [Oligoflexia bacterium]
MKICVVGLWHLGSVTAAALAHLGHRVMGLEGEQKAVEELRGGRAPLFEPGLDEMIAEGLCRDKQEQLSFHSIKDHTALVDFAPEVIWITFDTPVNENDEADTDFVFNQIVMLMPYFPEGVRVLVSSQVPIGFTRRAQDHYKKHYPSKRAHFAVSPENLRLGKALQVFLNPDRIIVGSNSSEVELFRPLFETIVPATRLEWMSIESAEMTKHAINSFLATSVVFANEIALLCEEYGANAKEVARGLKSEERIGPKAYVGAGTAFSGGTLARDIQFLKGLAASANIPLKLIPSVKESNDRHKNWVKEKCEKVLGTLFGKRILVLGLTYKPNTDTLRRSLSIELIKSLIASGATISAYDPAVKRLPLEYFDLFKLVTSVHDGDQIEGCDAIVVSTEWSEFKEWGDEVYLKLKDKVIIDPNGFIEMPMRKAGATRYYAVGRR